MGCWWGCQQRFVWSRLWFFQCHVRMWELGQKEGWAPKDRCFWTVVLEKTLESPLDCKEIQPVHPKGGQSWMFIGRTDAEAEAPILWPPDAKSWLIGKDPDAGKDWRWEKKGTTEDEMVGWHHRLDGHEFEQALGVGDGQGGLVCCSPWGCKELDTTEWPQICRWHHPYGRKWRGTKKPLDESESGEWKSWLKAQHSENKDHGIRSHHSVGNRWGNSGNSVRVYFFGLQNHCRWWLQPWN